MTIWVSIDEAGEKLGELADLAAAGQDIVLSRDGVAIARLKPASPVSQGKTPKVAGQYSHLGPLTDPYLFIRPDPELEEDAEARDEDYLYRFDPK